MVDSRTEAEKIQDQTGASVISESKNVLKKRGGTGEGDTSKEHRCQMVRARRMYTMKYNPKGEKYSWIHTNWLS